MIPDINFLWVSGDLPWYAVRCLQSFLEHGHRPNLFTYAHPRNCPEMVKVVDGREILSDDKIFRYTNTSFSGHLAGFADWFRVELLLQRGGWWFDIDTICQSSKLPEDELIIAGCYEPKIKGVCNNAMYARNPSTEIMRRAAEICAIKGANVEFAETGPVLIGQLVEELGLHRFVAPEGMFNPVHYRDALLVLNDYPWKYHARRMSRSARSLRPIYKISCAKTVHLFSAMWLGNVDLVTGRGVKRGSVLHHLILSNGGDPAPLNE